MENNQTGHIPEAKKKVTAVRELIEELNYIKLNKTIMLQEVIFFDAVIAIIESKYIQKEKDQIKDTYWDGGEDLPLLPEDCEEYYNQTYGKHE